MTLCLYFPKFTETFHMPIKTGLKYYRLRVKHHPNVYSDIRSIDDNVSTYMWSMV